jgi:hypothetical protein
MRRTPPVRVQIQPQWVTQAAVAAFIALAAAGLAGWVTTYTAAAWPLWLAVPGLGLLAWREAAVRPRRLRWDGQAWWLAEPGSSLETAVTLTVLIDLGDWLLLRAVPGPRWLPLSRRQQGPHWGALRATLFAAPGGAVSR